jgi:hypothetical protein
VKNIFWNFKKRLLDLVTALAQSRPFSLFGDLCRSDTLSHLRSSIVCDVLEKMLLYNDMQLLYMSYRDNKNLIYYLQKRQNYGFLGCDAM